MKAATVLCGSLHGLVLLPVVLGFMQSFRKGGGKRKDDTADTNGTDAKSRNDQAKEPTSPAGGATGGGGTSTCMWRRAASAAANCSGTPDADRRRRRAAAPSGGGVSLAT